MMQLLPIINAKLSRFRDNHGLENEDDGTVFERYANEVILSNHQPNGSSVDDEFLNVIDVGGSNDIGLDGICIKLNGILIRSLEDAEDIIEVHNNADIEFIFIQSKYKSSFKQDEYGKFIMGVKDFLNDKHYQPMNESVKYWLQIKEYLTSDEVMLKWIIEPKVRLYYVAMGSWNDDPHITSYSKQFKNDVDSMNMYGEIFINYIDAERFKKIIDENENQFSAVINTIDTLSLTSVTGVDNSIIILCTAPELMKLLVTDDGVLRKGLFNDNVRDYQGGTTINQDIFNTIERDPESFVLMNNGVTIICSEMVEGNRKITVRNPRIVNGCQTCTVLYNAYRKGADIQNVVLVGKVISTDNSDITNKVIRGTNRQNIVYDEAFECTREFHKQLEELFAVLSEDRDSDKIYYERRSKQYYDNIKIKPSQRVSFRILIQSFVSIFLEVPHLGHKHESKLLQMYAGKIFVDGQSKYPYYVSALIYMKIEQFLKSDVAYNDLRTYRSHIQMIFRILAGGYDCDINNEKSIDKYCQALLKIIDDRGAFQKYAVDATDVFKKVVDSWVNEKGGEYRYGIKDSQGFTEYLLNHLRVNPHTNVENRGVVTKVALDRYGKYFGFIINNHASYFFHSGENQKLDFLTLQGKDVLFDVEEDRVTHRDKAINIRIVG